MYFKNPRDNFLQKIIIEKKNPPFFKNTSWIRRYKLFSKTYFSEKIGKICKVILNMKGEMDCVPHYFDEVHNVQRGSWHVEEKFKDLQ